VFTLYIVLALAFALWLSLSCLWLLMVSTPTLRASSRRRRRGGFVKRAASPTQRVATTHGLREPETTVFSSSLSRPGDQLAGSAILAKRREQSRLTELSSFGKETGEAGESGAPRGDAA
jgi:hypothetical protein